MDRNRVEGNWKEVKGKIKQQWGPIDRQRSGPDQWPPKDRVRKDVDDLVGRSVLVMVTG